MVSSAQLGINKIEKADGMSCSLHKSNKQREFWRVE